MCAVIQQVINRDEIGTNIFFAILFYSAQKRFLAVATAHTKPNNAGVQKLLTDTANAINEIQQFREERRASAVFNHLTAVSESVPALDWVNEVSTAFNGV